MEVFVFQGSSWASLKRRPKGCRDNLYGGPFSSWFDAIFGTVIKHRELKLSRGHAPLTKVDAHKKPFQFFTLVWLESLHTSL